MTSNTGTTGPLPTVAGWAARGVEVSRQQMYEELRRAGVLQNFPPRTKTILLVQGMNDLTGRPIRVYITPKDKLITVETLGQLERN